MTSIKPIWTILSNLTGSADQKIADTICVL